MILPELIPAQGLQMACADYSTEAAESLVQ
jgi:hypothetical protein